jgi:hypothetical protein
MLLILFPSFLSRVGYSFLKIHFKFSNFALR